MYEQEEAYEMKSGFSVASARHEPSRLSKTADEVELARFGKKQQLKRRFRLISIVGLTCTLMITWEAIIGSFAVGLKNGGPAGLVYGFLFAWFGSTLQALVQAEMGSMIPIAGGYYNWVAILAPPWCSKFLSYLTGWITVIGYQANIASVAYAASLMTQGLITLNHPEYDFQRWHGTLIFYALIFLCVIINTYLARLLPHIETFVLLSHIIGFFCILIPLVYLAPHGSAKDVFATFGDDVSWGSQGLGFFVGLSITMYPFVGSDAATHMAEEIEGASLVIPRSMIASVTINGVFGFSILIACLFCMGDVKTALDSPTNYPYMEIFYFATGSTGAASAMSAIIIAAFATATCGFLATASRMTWAFARENGLPGSATLSKVEPRTMLPLYCIGISAVISLLLALINIGSDTAFNALVSIVISAYYTAYSISAVVLLYRRLITPPGEMYYGPFSLGRAGVPVIVLSLIYSFVGVFFSFWPEDATVTPATMNWSIVIFGGVFLFSMVFWFAHSRKVYTGPVVEDM